MNNKAEKNKQTEYKKNYNKENYSCVHVYFTKEQKELLNNYCDERNLAISEFIKNLIRKEIGSEFDKKQDYEPVKIYFTSAASLLFVCGSRWLHVSPPKDGYRFRINLCSRNAPWQLAEYFKEKRPDEKIFNRWIKIYSKDENCSSYGDELADEQSLLNMLSNNGYFDKYWLIYDGTGQNKLTFPE